MADNTSDSESSDHSSQCDSEYDYIPGYIMEVETKDTSRKIGTIDAFDREILGDYDACLYADEPPASEEWYAEYLKKSEETKQQNEMLQRRLDGVDDVKSW